ncbi:MAG: hypothetical protein DME25_21680 [Verrucomicrobia bacterium]|nr:MAG: hypothetical protein DME25_21680 [Verrucomicrobiota bacterium]
MLQQPHRMNRRQFVKSAAVATAGLSLVSPAPGAPSAARLRAAVIGHTGRGDYGHSLDTIFANRPGVELVAVADPDDAGRARAARKIAAPRQYADYRQMLENNWFQSPCARPTSTTRSPSPPSRAAPIFIARSRSPRRRRKPTNCWQRRNSAA